MAQPSGEWVLDLGLPGVADVHERGAARTSVQVLIGTTGGEVNIGRRHIKRYRPHRVGEVPHHQSTGVMNAPRDAGEV